MKPLSEGDLAFISVFAIIISKRVFKIYETNKRMRVDFLYYVKKINSGDSYL